MKLYLDEDLSQRVAEGLRARGHDALSSHEAGNDGLLDEQQLQFATEHHRHVVSYNRRDYLALADRWFRQERQFLKILLLTETRASRADIGSQIRVLEQYLNDRQDDPNLLDCVEFV